MTEVLLRSAHYTDAATHGIYSGVGMYSMARANDKKTRLTTGFCGLVFCLLSIQVQKGGESKAAARARRAGPPERFAISRRRFFCET
jgi:hypothetical protein